MTGHQRMEMCGEGFDAVLKARTFVLDGWKPNHVYLLLWEDGGYSVRKYREEVDKKLADGNWEDYFDGFISGEDHVQKALAYIGGDVLAQDQLFVQLKNGARFLYADEGQLETYYAQSSEFKHASSTETAAPNIGEVDPTPGAVHTTKPSFPTEGDHRVAMDGQNIKRKGDHVYDPDAEVGFEPSYYEVGQKDLEERNKE